MNLTLWNEWIYNLASLSLKLLSLTSADSVKSDCMENCLLGVRPWLSLLLIVFRIFRRSLWFREFLMSWKEVPPVAKFLDTAIGCSSLILLICFWACLVKFTLAKDCLLWFSCGVDWMSLYSFNSWPSKSTWSSSFSWMNRLSFLMSYYSSSLVIIWLKSYFIFSLFSLSYPS